MLVIIIPVLLFLLKLFFLRFHVMVVCGVHGEESGGTSGPFDMLHYTSSRGENCKHLTLPGDPVQPISGELGDGISLGCASQGYISILGAHNLLLKDRVDD